MSKAEELIACLEGEIAKRDARIVELENELSDIDFARRVSLQNESDLAETLNLLRAELASLKAQEPVAEVKHGPLDSSGWPEFAWVETIGDFDLENLPNGMKLYAYPVSEAKAQGVVMPEREEFEDVYSAEYGTPVSVLKLLREGENYIEKPQHSDRLNSSWWMWQKACARLNAALSAGNEPKQCT